MGGRGRSSAGKRGSITTTPTPTPSQAAETIDRYRADEIRAQMGQTGTEAGSAKGSWKDRLYVATSDSFTINRELDEYPDRKLSDKTLNAARQIDQGMKPLPVDLSLTRFEDSSSTLNTLGFNFLLDGVEVDSLGDLTPKELNDLFVGRTRARQAYISTSYDKNKNVFRSRDVRIDYTVKRGTHAIITDNDRESEILLGRGYDQKVTGASMGKNEWGDPMLILSVEIEPTGRSKWYELP